MNILLPYAHTLQSAIQKNPKTVLLFCKYDQNYYPHTKNIEPKTGTTCPLSKMA
jgi:hypothetical protein